MNPTQPTEESRENGIRLRRVAWLRTGMTGALWLPALAALGAGMVWIPKGEFAMLAGRFLVFFVGVPLLIISAVSTLIARALFRGSRRGMTAAIIFDAIAVIPFVLLLVAMICGGAMSASGQAGRLLVGSIAAAFVLLAGGEAVWLLAIGRRTRARRGSADAGMKSAGPAGRE